MVTSRNLTISRYPATTIIITITKSIKRAMYMTKMKETALFTAPLTRRGFVKASGAAGG
ncbi:twin-arginine translocation signal domain-containing protein, partial [Morganella morganii]|uniref:twin-arginine translocation signal domain-containing protein n=1 Tax=Morganella morganii TaxID=582 RepID=UPI0034D4A23E